MSGRSTARLSGVYAFCRMDTRDIAQLEVYRALKLILTEVIAMIDREIDALDAAFAQFERDMLSREKED